MATNDLSDEVKGYLTYCGLSKNKIRNAKKDTRLYHDLGIYGDVAELYVESLIDKYEVDMSSFDFEKYFPLEFIGETAFQKVMYWAIPFLGLKARKTQKFKPLTLSMIEKTIETKQWIDGGGYILDFK